MRSSRCASEIEVFLAEVKFWLHLANDSVLTERSRILRKNKCLHSGEDSFGRNSYYLDNSMYNSGFLPKILLSRASVECAMLG